MSKWELYFEEEERLARERNKKAEDDASKEARKVKLDEARTAFFERMRREREEKTKEEGE